MNTPLALSNNSNQRSGFEKKKGWGSILEHDGFLR